MNLAAKRALAGALAGAAGDLLDRLDDGSGYYALPELAGVPREELAAQLARWLRDLPGAEWDVRLPDPRLA